MRKIARMWKTTVNDQVMVVSPGNQNGTLQALTNALNIFTKQARCSSTSQLQPAITSSPAAAIITATITA